MEMDGLCFHHWSDEKDEVVNKFKELRNPNIIFRDGRVLYFMHSIIQFCFLFCISLTRSCVFNVVQEKLFFMENDEGKTVLEEASALGQLDATFFSRMLMMTEGTQRKHEALDLLNDA